MSASTATPAAHRVRPFYWSLRRELWENRSIYIAPLAVAAQRPVARPHAVRGRGCSGGAHFAVSVSRALGPIRAMNRSVRLGVRTSPSGLSWSRATPSKIR